jgi:hypothetical protein
MPEIDLASLIYVSKKPIGSDEDESIVSVSVPRNRSLKITGALASTSENYVQILEGPSKSIAELMHSIQRDSRHSEITVLREWNIDRRIFSAWSLAYSGPSNYMAKHVGDLTCDEERILGFKIDECIRLLTGLSHT